jgi:hypothetical protein
MGLQPESNKDKKIINLVFYDRAERLEEMKETVS